MFLFLWWWRMKKTLLLKTSKCTGCEMCVDVCAGRKKGVYEDGSARIRIVKDDFDARFLPLLCEQCREHPCAEACPVGAIQYGPELSIFKVDEETCTGCGACAEACPYEGISIEEGVALKCDLCAGDAPCAKVCYPGALRFVETNEESLLADLENKLAKLKRLREVAHE